MKKRIGFIAAAALCVLLLAACGKKTPELSGAGVLHETEFGGIYIKCTIDDFNKLGFAYGDSVDITFSNGYKLEDLPYYNGYYVDAGQPLLIAYPGYDYIKAAINYGNDLWEEAGLLQAAQKEDLWVKAVLAEGATAKITRREAGKYADIQKARDIHYSDDRSKYPSDTAFANFRNMTVGNLTEGAVWRSASPCDNQHGRVPYVNALMKEAGIACILDLSDSEAKIEGYIGAADFPGTEFLPIYESGNVIPLALNMNYLSDDFRDKIAAGFSEMAGKDGPYLIHCTEGKDRTGFVCMLLEALCGASYREIADDYMLTYDNYYKITEASDKERYDVIQDKNLNAMLRFVVGDPEADLSKADLSGAARKYLLAGGMTEEEISVLLSKVTK